MTPNPTPSHIPGSIPTPERKRSILGGWGMCVLWVIVFLSARLVLDQDLELAPWIKVTAALAPVIPTALFLRSVILGVRTLDELHRRVHLEALVIAYPLSILLLTTLGLLELAIELPSEDWSYRHVWPFLVLFYVFGMVVSWKRYK